MDPALSGIRGTGQVRKTEVSDKRRIAITECYFNLSNFRKLSTVHIFLYTCIYRRCALYKCHFEIDPDQRFFQAIFVATPGSKYRVQAQLRTRTSNATSSSFTNVGIYSSPQAC